MNVPRVPNLAHRCEPGGGNATIRTYQCEPHWRAAGVPTGTYESGPHHMGYKFLDDRVIGAIADAFTQINRLLASGRFTALTFSGDEELKFGGRIFCTAQVVRDHIVEELGVVTARHGVRLVSSIYDPGTGAGDFRKMIVDQTDVLFVFNDNEEQFREHYTDPANPYGVAT